MENRFYSNNKTGPGYTRGFTAPTSDVTAGSSVTVRWGATSSWGNPTSGSNYRLQVRYNGGSWSDVATTGTTASRAYTISSTSSYNTVQFRVRAESGGGNSSYRESSTVDIVPGQPPSISYPSSVTAGDNISVSWEAGPGAYTYQLQRRYRNTDGTYTSWSTVYTGSSRSATVATASNKGYTDVQFRGGQKNPMGKPLVIGKEAQLHLSNLHLPQEPLRHLHQQLQQAAQSPLNGGQPHIGGTLHRITIIGLKLAIMMAVIH